MSNPQDDLVKRFQAMIATLPQAKRDQIYNALKAMKPEQVQPAMRQILAKYDEAKAMQAGAQAPVQLQGHSLQAHALLVQWSDILRRVPPRIRLRRGPSRSWILRDRDEARRFHRVRCRHGRGGSIHSQEEVHDPSQENS